MHAAKRSTETLVELFRVGTPTPSLFRSTVTTAQGEVQYLDRRELTPELALTVTAGVAGTLCRRIHNLRSSLRTLYRVSPSAHDESIIRTSCALMYSRAEEDSECIETLRSRSAQALAGLWRSPHRAASLAGFLLDGEEPIDAEEIEQGPLGKLLGRPLERSLVVQMEGRKSLQYDDYFRSAQRKAIVEETFEVHDARLKATKTTGRYRAVAVRGTLEAPGFQLIDEKTVIYDETDRPMISKAVGEPGRRLRMTITRITAPSNTIKPKVTHKLSNLRFEE